ncbi:glutaredoxin [Cryptococcus sp. DSM 104549]
MYGSVSTPSSSPARPRSAIVEPRRAFSLPTLAMSFHSSLLPSSSTSKPPILPLTHKVSSPGGSSSSGGRSSVRRFSYGIKNRASRYSLPLTIGGLITLALFFLVSSHSSSEFNRFTAAEKLHLRSRSKFSAEEHQRQPFSAGDAAGGHHRAGGHRPDGERDNGISLLTMSEDELIAEDDLFWDSYTDPEPMSAEEAEAEAELQAHRQDVITRNNAQSLRALVWWLAEGGILPNGFEVPSKSALRKGGALGVERMLEAIDGGDDEQEIFENGWSEFANKRFRIVVFSKTHCPYSRNAKSILGNYRLSPAPFIIELDQRSDMDQIQTLLQRITGRRTVPNILLDFTSIGGSDDITLLHSEGGLQRRFEDMEVVPGMRRRSPPTPAPLLPVGVEGADGAENAQEAVLPQNTETEGRRY